MFLICKNCNWEIIPMLLGAWFLGLLFWMLFFKRRHNSTVEQLTTQLDQSKIQIEKNKRDNEAIEYKNKKLTTDVTNYTKKIKSLEVKIQQLEKGK